MDINNDFISLLQANTILSSNLLIQDYLPKPLFPPDSVVTNLPFVQAYGNICSTYPYYYETSELDSYCLIFTDRGAGTLTYNNHNFSIVSNTLALIDCRINYKIKINQSPWNYKVFYIKGAPLPFIYNTITDYDENIYTFSSGSDIPGLIQKLYTHLDKNPDKFFLHAKLINELLFDLLIEKNRPEESGAYIPSYLTEIKNDFDKNYCNCFSLDTLELQYPVSKYRICREFTAHYGISPIQYLNTRRIEVAKEALRCTNKKISEIGRMVGFDNTNHFIRLFKQKTGVTPLIYREQPPAAVIIK